MPQSEAGFTDRDGDNAVGVDVMKPVKIESAKAGSAADVVQNEKNDIEMKAVDNID